MVIFNILSKTINGINKITDDLDKVTNQNEQDEANKENALGLFDDEKKHIKDEKYEATDFEEEPDGDEVNDDDYYGEDN